MMTHGQIEAAIGRLEKMEPGDYVGTTVSNIANVMWELMDGKISGVELRDTLIDLLKQADPDAYMILPVDADGKPWHVGDVTSSIHNERLTVRSISPDNLVCTDRYGCSHTITPPSAYRHHHAPTIESVLRMFLAESEDAMRNGYDDVPDEIYAEYVGKIRELMQDD